MNRLLVNIDVPDLAAAERFYCAALGLTPARRFGAGAVELLGLEAPLYLLLNAAGTRPIANDAVRRDYARHWTPVHLDVAVDDLDASIARASAAGAVKESGPDTQTWGRIARFADPFGHGFCLLQFLGRGYDEIAGG
jgi:catechol 2,3-dioxygenase-like lactoylglutathione lyase family enzyme